MLHSSFGRALRLECPNTWKYNSMYRKSSNAVGRSRCWAKGSTVHSNLATSWPVFPTVRPTAMTSYSSCTIRRYRRHSSGTPQQLGDYLHRQKRFRLDNDEWWNIFRRKLERTSELLCRSCTGTMLGPPLMRSTKEVQTFVEVVEGCPVDVSQHLRAGSKFVAGISYPARFPTRFEPNAYIWQPNHDFTTVRS